MVLKGEQVQLLGSMLKEFDDDLLEEVSLQLDQAFALEVLFLAAKQEILLAPQIHVDIDPPLQLLLRVDHSARLVNLHKEGPHKWVAIPLFGIPVL